MILDKIEQPQTHLNRDDLSPNQKKHLWTVMMRYGASQGFAYDRFFKEGFRQWELIGIDRAKEDFLRIHGEALRGTCSEADAADAVADTGDCFYDKIGRARLKLTFMSYMNGLGMGYNTVLERFGKSQEDDFKQYERMGIRAVVKEFEREVAERNIV